MRRRAVEAEVLGPRSLTTGGAFGEGFSPSALDEQQARGGIRTVSRVVADWSRAEVVTQRGDLATVSSAGDANLEAGADKVRRFLCVDVDAPG
jgi:hypothetical protein